MTAPVPETRRRFYCSIMRRDEVLGTYARWWVFINAAGSRETVLGPVTMAPTGVDALDLVRVDHDLASALIVRTGEWNVTEYGFTAWVEFGDEWSKVHRRMSEAVPAGGLTLGVLE